MPIRLQQFQIFKVNSSRLKKKNYNINLTINEGRRNGEVVSIGDSQMLRSLRKIKGQEDDLKNQISQLMAEKRNIKHQPSSQDNIQRLLEVEQNLDQLLFVPEIVAVVFEKDRHYHHIGNFGFKINGTKFVRFLCSAGNARRNTAIFIDENYEKELKKLLNNGRKEDIQIIPNKFSAYFSLASSSTHKVSTPRFCVIPDCEIIRSEQVDYITEHPSGDDTILPIEKDITFNLWDGQGLISPDFAETWAGELDLDYVPSSFIIRANFIKGMVCVFDFHRFGDQFEKYTVKDVWGNNYDIRNADIILTASQFKLWFGWDSLEEYVLCCAQNDMSWGISRWSPKIEKDHVSLNYQFLQALKLNSDQIESLCLATIEYLKGVVENDSSYTLLYLLGDVLNQDYDPDLIYSKIDDSIAKAIVLNPQLIHDSYIQNHILRSLNKKIRESYIGNLVVNGFYTTMINDPYAFCEYMLGLPVVGLLKRGEHYNQYWLNKRKKRVAAMRAPLTWASEVNVLNLKQDSEMDDWYIYLNSGAIYNIHGCDHMLHGGSDCDGDLVCLTDQQDIIDGAKGGLPIHYETKKAVKTDIVEKDLYLTDIQGFNTSVGFLTNISTTMYAMLPEFEEGSEYYASIINRLKQCRKEQGAIIDSAKGLTIRPIPKHWTNWTKVASDASVDEIYMADYNNTIMVDKRPYFFRYLYNGYNKEYSLHNLSYNNYCVTTFGKTLKEVMENPITQKEQDIIVRYHRFSPLLNSDCLMNQICHYMEEKVGEICSNVISKPIPSLVLLLKDLDIPLDKEKLKKLYDVYKRYKSEKRNFARIKNNNGDELYKTIEQYHKFIRQQAFAVSNNIQELANLAVVICYEVHPTDSKIFAWGVFGEGIVKNIEKNTQSNCYLPYRDKNGKIKYLGNHYKLQEITINKKEDDYIQEEDAHYEKSYHF